MASGGVGTRPRLADFDGYVHHKLWPSDRKPQDVAALQIGLVYSNAVDVGPVGTSQIAHNDPVLPDSQFGVVGGNQFGASPGDKRPDVLSPPKDGRTGQGDHAPPA